MGKTKVESLEESENPTLLEIKEEVTYEEKVANCTHIAKPLASKRLSERCYKLIKKAMKQKSNLHSGLKDVQKEIRKGETGIVVFAGDVSPVDIMIHLPAVCEERNIPYVYTPSRKDLGTTLGVKRGCLMVMIRESNEYKERFEELNNDIKTLGLKLD